MKLVFASNNQHKLEEVRKILPSTIEVVSLHDIGYLSEIDETGETLEENSLIKARTIWEWLNLQTLAINGVFADDTGLEIDALHGHPGVRSARWAGEPSNDANNRKKVLSDLGDQTNRSARFRTVITWIGKDHTTQVEGIVEGDITYEECGTGGFGYDSIFIPKGYTETFATLSPETKNSISHRGRAMQALRKSIEKNSNL